MTSSIRLLQVTFLSATAVCMATTSCTEPISEETFSYARDIERPAKEKRQAIFEYLLKKADIDLDESAIPSLTEYLVRKTDGYNVWSLKHIIVELELCARGYENKKIPANRLKEIIDQRIKAYKKR